MVRTGGVFFKTTIDFLKFYIIFQHEEKNQDAGCERKRLCAMMKNLDDHGYKKLFSNREIFRQLITGFVHEAWVKDLDFSRCELMKDSFVSKQYKSRFSDLIYKIKLRGRDFYIVVLLEFKATPDRFVALQILGYVVDFYRHLVDAQKNLKKLPPVFPIMLYNGERRWTAPVNLSALIEGSELLGKQTLHFEYFPIIENAFSKAELLKIGNIVSTLFLAEAHYNLALLERELSKLFKKRRDKQAAALFLNWFRQLALHGRLNESDYKRLEDTFYDPKEVNMLVNAIKREKKQMYNQGLEKGMEKIARMMIASGEPIEKIRRYTGLSTVAIQKLKANGQKGLALRTN